jgi:hypothetical protein
VGTPIITESPVVSLTVNSSDSTAGVTHLAIGQMNWEWEGETLVREVVGGQPLGQVIADAGALNGTAIRATVAADPVAAWSSPEINLLAPAQYRAYFRLKASDHVVPSEVARLEVIDSQLGRLIGLQRLHGPDFRQVGSYQEFYADFDYQTARPVVLKLVFLDAVDISLDRIIIMAYPTLFTPTPASDYDSYRLKVIDAAGNASSDLLVLPALELEPRVYLPAVLKAAAE